MIITDKSILEQVSKETTLEECKSLDIFAKMEKELEEAKDGLGLSAIQINIPIRAILLKYKNKIYRMINPVLGERSDPFVQKDEGCLSCPGVRIDTDRWKQINIKWLDYDTGKMKEAEGYDLSAVLAQHEVDHLDGILLYKRAHHIVKVGRNDPCPCGSGKKYKKCCLL